MSGAGRGRRARRAGGTRAAVVSPVGVSPRKGGPRTLPPLATMQRAVAERDASFEGVFILGVTTTGIFCRPGCPARTPRPENVAFFPDAAAAMRAGLRPCRRCRPLSRAGEAPAWIRPLLAELESAPSRRLRDSDLASRGLAPERVRRWFLAEHGVTFQGWQRARRLGKALGELAAGGEILATGIENGFESASGFAAAIARITGAPPGASRGTLRVLVDRIATPLGTMVAAATDRHLRLLEFADRRDLPERLLCVASAAGGALFPGRCEPIARVREELAEYFAGARRSFDVPVATGGTPFQERVWSELRKIPPGETRSYAELAAAVGRPSAIRAVGRANGENRIAIVVPCHRVVGADGNPTGYSGGIWRKLRLLALEAPPDALAAGAGTSGAGTSGAGASGAGASGAAASGAAAGSRGGAAGRVPARERARGGAPRAAKSKRSRRKPAAPARR